jgi:hypothetical protein
MVVTVSNLFCTARSSRPHEAEYSRKLAAVDDGLQRTNRALIPNVGDQRSSSGTSADFQQYGGAVKSWVDAERRLDLKEEASDLKRQVVAAKTPESVRRR